MEHATKDMGNEDKQGQGPRFILNIEGKLKPWDEPTITTEQVIELGGWDPSQGAILIDKDNNERTLQPGEVIELKPGMGFSKKIIFKRGVRTMEERIIKELELLRAKFPDLQYKEEGHWILIPAYPLHEGWNKTITDVAFQIPIGYPGTPPYAFHVPVGLQFNGNKPNNYQEPTQNVPPFPGAWGTFSWSPDNGQWRATADLVSGSNLLNWALGFANRFKEGI